MTFQELKTHTGNIIAYYTANIAQKEKTLRLFLKHHESKKRKMDRLLAAYKDRLAALKEEYKLLEVGLLPDWAKEGYID